jgi:hypothetical protein
METIQLDTPSQRLGHILTRMGLSPTKVERASEGRISLYQVENMLAGHEPGVSRADAFVGWLVEFNSSLGPLSLPLDLLTTRYIWGAQEDSHISKDTSPAPPAQRRAS